jgi:hypothetical protein
MIFSATELGALGLFYAALSSPQVTMGCDHMLSALRVSRLGGASPSCLKLRGARKARSPIARQVSASDGRLRSSRRCCGPRLWTPSTLRDSRLEEAGPRSLELRGARKRGAPIARQVSASDGRLRSSRQSCGPRAQILEPFLARPRYALPRVDPTALLDPDPTVIHLLASRVLAT